MVAGDVAMDRADAEGRRNGEIGQAVILSNGTHQQADLFPVIELFTQENMYHRSTGVFGLERILVIEYCEEVRTEINRELR